MLKIKIIAGVLFCWFLAGAALLAPVLFFLLLPEFIYTAIKGIKNAKKNDDIQLQT